MNKIILLYGLPCTGKSTIFDSLLEINVTTQIRIDDIWIESFNTPEYTFEQSKVIYENLLLKLKKEISNNVSNILIEGVFASGDRLIEMKNISESKGYKFLSILLFCSIDVLYLRNQQRNNLPNKKVMGNEVIDFFKNKFNSSKYCDIAINTENIDKENIVSIIQNLLNNGR